MFTLKKNEYSSSNTFKLKIFKIVLYFLVDKKG